MYSGLFNLFIGSMILSLFLTAPIIEASSRTNVIDIEQIAKNNDKRSIEVVISQIQANLITAAVNATNKPEPNIEQRRATIDKELYQMISENAQASEEAHQAVNQYLASNIARDISYLITQSEMSVRGRSNYNILISDP